MDRAVAVVVGAGAGSGPCFVVVGDQGWSEAYGDRSCVWGSGGSLGVDRVRAAVVSGSDR